MQDDEPMFPLPRMERLDDGPRLAAIIALPLVAVMIVCLALIVTSLALA